MRSREDDGGAGAEVTGHGRSPAEVWDAFDNGVGSFEGELGSHAVEIGYLHDALREDGFGDNADARDGGVEGGELGLYVGGETGLGFRADSGTAGVVGAGDGDAVTVDGERGAIVGEGVAQIATDLFAVPVCRWDTGRRWNGAKMRQTSSRFADTVGRSIMRQASSRVRGLNGEARQLDRPLGAPFAVG
jgi:hypothetical protein